MFIVNKMFMILILPVKTENSVDSSSNLECNLRYHVGNKREFYVKHSNFYEFLICLN